MNTLEKWIHSIAIKSNDEALMFVMFHNKPEFKGALYCELIKFHPKELMSQFAAERKTRAHCHLIKRAIHRGSIDKAEKIAIQLNDFLGHYAESLLLLTHNNSEQTLLN